MARPNILLITADQHNADILSCYGNPVVRTPNIDALANRGVRFSQCFTPFPVCSPARTSIMTGMWAHHHGAVHNINMGRPVPGLTGDRPIFTDMLREAGYATALIGKKHMMMEGVPAMGFDHEMLVEGKCQFTANNEPDEYRKYLYAKGYGDEWKTWETVEYQRDFWLKSPFPLEDYSDVFIRRHAVDYIREQQEPYFMWLSFCNPHNTWDPPEPYDTMYDPATIPLPRRVYGELDHKPPAQKEWARNTFPTGPGNTPELGREGLSPDSPGWGVFSAPDDPYGRLSDEKLRGMLAAYYAQVTLVDDQIGMVMAALAETGQLDNTLIIYTSDHGDYLGNNWLYYKSQFLYDSLTRVPMICSWTGHIPQGTVSDSLVSLVDLAPTFIAAAGAQGNEDLDGCDLCQGATTGDQGFRDAVFSERVQSSMIRTHEWKLVEYISGDAELYNLVDDPGEHRSLYGQPELADLAAGLSQRLAEWRARS